MFTERFRSHHDAERGLDALLGKPRGHVQRLLKMKPWSAVEARLREAPEWGGGGGGIYIHVPNCDQKCNL
ncbi:MAG: hypothetical protein LBL76_04945 [Treponema sp.]|jgi:hypothetical protein|nr:hypothetical protein [Treponema sp.]